jgi:hypothetical protein
VTLDAHGNLLDQVFAARNFIPIARLFAAACRRREPPSDHAKKKG